ncbi:MAG: hypothetical protein Q9M13_08360 [Mariprofundales bacterium]|nr:hypothetical protein [Mariprofundales bacterium]
MNEKRHCIDAPHPKLSIARQCALLNLPRSSYYRPVSNGESDYNRAEYLSERTRIMQHWADYLDGLRQGADIVPLHRQQRG